MEIDGKVAEMLLLHIFHISKLHLHIYQIFNWILHIAIHILDSNIFRTNFSLNVKEEIDIFSPILTTQTQDDNIMLTDLQKYTS